MIRSLMVVVAAGLLAMGVAAAEGNKPHRVALHVDQNDPAVMNLVLNNAKNLMEYYESKNEEAEIEIVAYSGGLHMLRADTSPVKDRIKQMAEAKSFAKITFAACNNTKQGMEKREGHAITLLPQATLVPSGVVRLVELQEQGWSYLRP